MSMPDREKRQMSLQDDCCRRIPTASRSSAFILFLIIVLASWPIAAAAQTTTYVPADQPTIQAGINAAQNGNTVFVAPGTYSENIDFHEKTMTVTSGASAYSSAQVTIAGRDDGAVVTFETGETAAAVLNGFVLTNGHTSVGSS